MCVRKLTKLFVRAYIDIHFDLIAITMAWWRIDWSKILNQLWPIFRTYIFITWPKRVETMDLANTHVDALVPERRNSSALATVLRLSCTNPSMCIMLIVPPVINTGVPFSSLYNPVQTAIYKYHGHNWHKPRNTGMREENDLRNLDPFFQYVIWYTQ